MAIHRHSSCYLLCNNYLERFYKVTYMSKNSREEMASMENQYNKNQFTKRFDYKGRHR
jgi:hypothetical protein